MAMDDGGVDVAAVAAAADVATGLESRALFQNPRSIALVVGGGLICSCRSGCAGNSSIAPCCNLYQGKLLVCLVEEWEKLEFDCFVVPDLPGEQGNRGRAGGVLAWKKGLECERAGVVRVDRRGRRVEGEEREVGMEVTGGVCVSICMCRLRVVM
jgi:hypothetical protein